MKSKFKIGDKVVVARDLAGIRNREPFIVSAMKDFGSPFGLAYLPSVGSYQTGAYEDELELEEIYNSPLYQALK